MALVTPLRFVAGVLGLWIAARVMVLMPLYEQAAAENQLSPRVAHLAAAVPPHPPSIPPPATRARSIHPPLAPARPIVQTPSIPRADIGAGFAAASIAAPGPTAAPSATARATRAAGTTDRAASIPAAPPAPLASPALLAAPAGAGRWSGSLYLFHRRQGDTALATAGQLGGSQAGARLAYRLNPRGPPRFAVAARVSSPLDDARGAEAAAGLDWHPLPGAPLRVSIERRVDLGGAGRNAWSAYAAGGFWRDLGRGAVVEGYAQAGIVGAHRQDLFADGALRAGHRSTLGAGSTLTLGAGAWGAAQPRVERLDIGPRVALGLPIAGVTTTLAAEWRIRVAGDASPGSGLAITLATDF